MSYSNIRRLRLYVILLCMIGVLLMFSYLVLLKNVVEKTKLEPTVGMPDGNKQTKGLRNVKSSTKRPESWMTGTLKPHRKAVVPNIAHFIWFSCHDFRFDHLIPVLSAYYVMKADRILFHTDCEPDSRWWKEAKVIPVLEVVKRQRMTHIFGKKLNPSLPEHAADVARLEILRDFGGIYLDTDVVVVNSLEPLRHYEFVIGQPATHVFNNGMIVASKNSTFLKMFYDSYKSYRGRCWTCNSGTVPLNIARQHPGLVHIENSSVVEWNYKKLFFGKLNWWENRYTIHVWIRAYFKKRPGSVKFTADNIKALKTSYGEIARYIYYGTKDILNENLTLSRMEKDAKDIELTSVSLTRNDEFG